MIAVSVIILIIYSAIIISFAIAWTRLKPCKEQLRTKKILAALSIVIPIRNESKNLPKLISALNKQNFRNFEVIFADDHSTDQPELVIEKLAKFDYKIIKLPPDSTGKKQTLKAGVKSATCRTILATDADCIPHPNWTKTIASCVANSGGKLFFAPVIIEHEKILSFAAIQTLEYASLNMSSAGSIAMDKPIMASAANMVFDKQLFLEADLREEHPSGDDVFLLEYAKEKGMKTGFIKSRDAVVLTQAQKTPQDFIRQRIRWASKSKYYKNRFSQLTAIIVFAANLVIPLSLLFAPVYVALGVFAAKTLVDYLALNNYLNFFSLGKLKPLIIPMEIFYIFYVITVAVLSLFGKFEWKDRKYKA